jgi:DNA-binding NarL/FixJ family response regulator
VTTSERENPRVRVLVVDDSALMRKLIADVLRSAPELEVVGVARDGAEAIEKTAALKPDVVTLDVEMPGMTGLELLGALRRVAPDLAVIVMTAHASLDYAMGALRNSADEFLQKPVKPDHLLAIVTALVGKGHAA